MRNAVVLWSLVALLGALFPAVAGAVQPGDAGRPEYRVYVYTGGASGGATNAAVRAIRDLGRARGFQVVANGDPEQFTEERLARFRAVVFLNTQGDHLDAAQEAAFEAYFRNGGGFVGIGSAVESEPGWTFLTEILGTRAIDASDVQPAVVEVADQVHPAGAALPDYWTWDDAFYNFEASVRGESHVIATVDENTYTGGSMGFDHPVVWCKDHQGGRSFYSALGGNPAAFADADYVALFAGALEWAAGTGPGDCGATVWANYEMSFIARPPNIGEPIEFTVFPDGRVLNTSRTGDVWLHDPDAGTSQIIASLDVYSHSEDGLYGGEIDPDFETNGWVYLFSAPPTVEDVVLSDGSVVTQTTPPGNAPATSLDPTTWDPYVGYFQLSRFKFVDGATPSLDLASEQQILRVPNNRGTCCHNAGEIRFDSAGNLWLVTGDDTNAGGSDGYTPINDRGAPGGLYQNPAYDARRSAGNTNDLRGKLLRITVKDGDISEAEENELGGAYTVPEGNLFSPGAALARPEIYAMGLRNPFRLNLDENDVAYVTDYSPDARDADPERGPEGTGRFMVIDEPANYGWPFCPQPDLPYFDFDFATDTTGDAFECDDPAQGPRNDSRHNTGLEFGPPVSRSEVWYTFEDKTPCAEAYLPPEPFEECDFLFPELLTGGVGPHGAAPYHYDPDLASDTKFPEYFDNAVFFAEFTRDYMREIRLDDDGNVHQINDLLTCGDFNNWPEDVPFLCDDPMDVKWGPNGEFYLMMYGDGFFNANPDAGLVKFAYVKGQRAPIALASASPTDGQPPLTVQFSSAGSFDPDPGDSITFAWDLDADGTVDSIDPNPLFTYTLEGQYIARLTVTDSNGVSATDTVTITVGNTTPTVVLDAPPNGGFFSWGDLLEWSITVTDPEDGSTSDGSIACSDVTFTVLLGHDTHAHPESSDQGCSGTYETLADNGDHGSGRVFQVVVGSYTDNGGAGGVPALTGVDEHILNHRRLEAEHFTEQAGVNVRNRFDSGSSVPIVDGTGDGDWISFDPVNLLNIDSLTFRAGDNNEGGFIDVRLDAVDGPVLATATIEATGSNNAYADTNVPISDPGGTHALYFVFRAFDPADTGNNFINLNWIEANGPGIGLPPGP